MCYTVCYFTGILYAVLRQISMLFIDNKDSVSCILSLQSLFRSLRASSCSVDCSTARVEYVCGTDGVTYTSRCELQRAKQCDGKRAQGSRVKVRVCARALPSSSCRHDHYTIKTSSRNGCTGTGSRTPASAREPRPASRSWGTTGTRIFVAAWTA